MMIKIDPHAAAVLEFMQNHVPAAKLVAVAKWVSAAAPVFWGHHGAEDIEKVLLASDAAATAQTPADGPHRLVDGLDQWHES